MDVAHDNVQSRSQNEDEHVQHDIADEPEPKTETLVGCNRRDYRRIVNCGKAGGYERGLKHPQGNDHDVTDARHSGGALDGREAH